MTHAAAPEGDPVSGWAGTPTERGHFRPDIEGLRAVAVLTVLLFHVGVPGFAGGFIGVDVFYVISGFLITGLLRRELIRSGRVDLISFYARRARRLLPAALVVIVVTLVVSAVVLPRIRWGDIATDAAAAALYVSNYRFALEGLDYLGDTRLSPLLHYWSLAVEEQFYIFWPILIIVTARWLSIRRLAWAIGLVIVVSFIASVVLTEVAAPIAFFSLPTRAWELAIGALLAVAPEPLLPRLPAVYHRAAGWVGLGLVIGSAVLIDPALSYPGTIALVPTLGAALVIASGATAGGVGRWLATSVPRWLGRISYSLYLWHWPLIILVPLAIGQNGLLIRSALAGVAVVIAHASTRFIEQRFRQGQAGLPSRPSRVLGVSVLASVVVAGVALTLGSVLSPSANPTIPLAQIEADVRNADAVLASPRTSGPIPESLKRSLAWAANDLPPGKKTGCQVTKLGTDPTPCIYGDEDAATTMVLLGDSHALQWLPALVEIANERGWRIASFTKPACPPLDAVTWDRRLLRGYQECLTWLEQVELRIADEDPALIVMSGARHHELYEGGEHYTFADRPDDWRAALERSMARMHALSEDVVWLSDTPRNRSDPLDCMALHAAFEDCQTSRAEALDDAYASLESTAAANTGTVLVSMTELICPGDVCPLAFGDYPVYRDSHHLTATFARLLSRPLIERLP